MKLTKLTPPTYLLIAIALLVALHFLCPIVVWMPRPWNWFGVVLIVLGTALDIWADAIFKKVQTTVKPGETSSTLVTTGPFGFSRHPMYVGMVVMVLGVAVVLGSVTPLIVVVLFTAVLCGFVRLEEKSMTATFGEAYTEYCRTVRPWL